MNLSSTFYFVQRIIESDCETFRFKGLKGISVQDLNLKSIKKFNR